MKKYGKKLKEAREYLGYTQEQVAELLDMTRNMIVNIENDNREVKAEELYKFSKLYGISMEDLSEDDKEISSNSIVFARGFDALSEKDQKEILNLINFKNNYKE